MSSNTQLMRRVSSRVERALFVSIGLIAAKTLYNEGAEGLARDFVALLRKLPFINDIIGLVLDGEVSGAMKLLAGQDDSAAEGSGGVGELLPIPEHGVDPNKVIKILEAMKLSEVTAEEGKAFAYTYTTKHDMGEFAKSLGKAYELYTASAETGMMSVHVVCIVTPHTPTPSCGAELWCRDG